MTLILALLLALIPGVEAKTARRTRVHARKQSTSVPRSLGRPVIDEAYREVLYYQYMGNLKRHRWSAFVNDGHVRSSIREDVLMDAVWDRAQAYREIALRAPYRSGEAMISPMKNLLSKLSGTSEVQDWALPERLRVQLLEIKDGLRVTLDDGLQEELMGPLEQDRSAEEDESPGPEGLSLRSLYQLLAERSFLATIPGHEKLIAAMESADGSATQVFKDATAQEAPMQQDKIKDLFDFNPDSGTFADGRYDNSVRLYLFCRKNREFPCLMLMRDAQGNPVMAEDGVTPWAHPALASANRGRTFYQRNGYTPAGLYTIDGVMPATNRKRLFGNFRRLILNFVRGTEGDLSLDAQKGLLPESSRQDQWWKQAVVAQAMGRNLLRIHGTGKRARFPGSSYYPFVKTAGCISKLEGRYGNTVYKGQRELLDRMMEALGMAPKANDEAHIKGLLYVVEIDESERPVTLEDLIFLFPEGATTRAPAVLDNQEDADS